MKIQVGQKIKGHEIVWVSADKRIFGVHHPADLGCKGRIWAKSHFQKLSESDRADFRSAGFQLAEFDGVWYFMLESVKEYADIFRRCVWYTTNKASAFAYPEPMVYEN